jgi:Ca-activated chloride channel family protein
MSFANPWVLSLLLLVPVLMFSVFFRGNQSNMQVTLSLKPRSDFFSSSLDWMGFYLPFILRILCITLLIIALARPQKGQSFTSSKNLGLDIMLAVDTSQSMSALDLVLADKQVDRLTVVKKILADFVQKRTQDRLGLVVFGDEAFTQCPLTTDHGAIIDLIDHIHIGMVGNSTAIGSAIALAVKRMKDLQAKSKIIILMTDGQNTSGAISPLTAAKLAKELGIKIYTIGVGQDGEVPFKIDTPEGPRIIKQIFEIDEEALVQIAEETGGKYFRAQSTNDLTKVYDYINKLEKTEIEVKEYNSFKDLYESLLWLAFAFFVTELLLAHTLLYRIN